MDKKVFLNEKLRLLECSKFRSSFKLKDKDIEYIKNKGIDVIREHTMDFIESRLSDSIILNDGKQTPMKGHPAFIAQHATATCCRGCIEKWHKIKKGTKLTYNQKQLICDLIILWILKQLKNVNKD